MIGYGRTGVYGAVKIRRLLRRAPDEITNDVRTEVREVAEAVRADAMALVPRDTGDLATSIEVDMSNDGLAAVVGPAAKAARADARVMRANRRYMAAGSDKRSRLSVKNNNALRRVFYAVFVEFGTKFRAATPFMFPAYEANRAWGVRKIGEAVRRALTKLGGP